MPLFVDLRRDFRGLNFGAAAPEDVGVGDGDTRFFEVFVDGCFVLKDFGFLGAVHDSHDVDVAELWAAFAPIGVGHAVVASDFAAGFHFAAFRDCPVEEAVEASDAFSSFRSRFDVLKEGREAADDFFLVEVSRNFAEALEGDSGLFGAGFPWVFADFVDGELFFEVEEDVPFLIGELGGDGGHHDGGLVSFFTGRHGFAAHVTDAEGENAVRRHEEVFGGAGEFEEFGGVEIEGFANWDFQGCPEAVAGA